MNNTVDVTFTITPEYFVDMLKNGAFRITFLKSTGTERIMNCTLCSQIITEEKYVPTKAKEFTDDNPQIRIWDMDDKAWKSFKFLSLIDISILEEY